MSALSLDELNLEGTATEIISTRNHKPLCSTCTAVLNKRFRQRRADNGPFLPMYTEQDTDSWIVFLRNADNGCPLCCLLRRLFNKDICRRGITERIGLPQTTIQSIGFRVICTKIQLLHRPRNSSDVAENDGLVFYLQYKFQATEYTVDIEIGFVPMDDALKNHLQVSDLSSSESTFSRDIDGFEVRDSNSTASLSSWTICTNWLSECASGHTICKAKVFEDQRLPTRLISVGSRDSLPKLLNSEEISLAEIEAGVKYITLSHCWGLTMDPKSKLTSATEHQFRNGIKMGQLSRTFQDAITVTRRLAEFGIKYIWIDALCIFQDSGPDWRKEGALMGIVYGNSWCNLAASDGEDGRNGLFSTRDTSSIIPLIAKISNLENLQPVKPSGFRKFLQRFLKSDSEYLCFDIEQGNVINNAILNTRAWVHQERVLSARSLMFTNDQIFWECQQHQASETFPRGDLLFAGDETHIKRTMLSNSNTDAISVDDAMKAWTGYVREYSGKDLSHPEDKLPALSSVARQMQFHFEGARYLAGLWDLEVERMLLWRVERSAVRPKVYRAPSWSWASLDGIVNRWDITYRFWEESTILVKVIEAYVPVLENPFGQVGEVHDQGKRTELQQEKGSGEVLPRLERNDRTLKKSPKGESGRIFKRFLQQFPDDKDDRIAKQDNKTLDDPAASNPFRAFLHISGRIYKASIEEWRTRNAAGAVPPDTTSPTTLDPSNNPPTLNDNPDVAPSTPAPNLNKEFDYHFATANILKTDTQGENATTEKISLIFDPDISDNDFNTTQYLYFLPIEYEGRNKFVGGLVLEKLKEDGNGNGVFVRVGSFEVFHREIPGLLDSERGFGRGERLEREEYDSFDGKDGYTIFIV